MAHPWFVQQMERWGDDLSPEQFLTAFTDWHVWWHRDHGEWNGLPLIGFLSFHHDVIKALKKSFQRAGWTFPARWTTMQPNYENWRTVDGQPLNSINDPLKFSQEVENWHNFVHMNPLYPELPNATTNIWTFRFWALHHRIDEEFKACLQRSQPNVADVEQIYEKLEDRHATV